MLPIALGGNGKMVRGLSSGDGPSTIKLKSVMGSAYGVMALSRSGKFLSEMNLTHSSGSACAL
ncbi:MAG: hypothetical protein ACK55I_10315, partial [bacterium]